MGRSPCCSKEGLNRGAWTAQEDKILKEYIRLHGEGRWRNLPKKAGLKRCGKSCRLRWKNYLRPDVKRGNISSDEEELIIRLHKLLGNRWSLIAGRLPGRTDNEIKNYWNTNFGKKVKYSNKRGRTSTSRGNNTLKPTLKLAPMATPLTPKLDSNVTFPKAAKCSKVLFLNPLPNPTENKSNVEAVVEAEAAEEATVADAAVACNSIRNQMESLNLDSEFLLSTGEEEEELPIDLLLDFNVDDVLLSDLLNSDISNTYNNLFSCSDNNGRNPSDHLPTCSDQVDPTFSDELLTDWS